MGASGTASPVFTDLRPLRGFSRTASDSFSIGASGTSSTFLVLRDLLGFSSGTVSDSMDADTASVSFSTTASTDAGPIDFFDPRPLRGFSWTASGSLSAGASPTSSVFLVLRDLLGFSSLAGSSGTSSDFCSGAPSTTSSDLLRDLLGFSAGTPESDSPSFPPDSSSKPSVLNALFGLSSWDSSLFLGRSLLSLRPFPRSSSEPSL